MSGGKRPMLIGVLALVGVAWAVDALWIRSTPRSASAAAVDSSPSAAESETDVAALLDRLQRSSADLEALPLTQVRRNPFAATTAFEQTLRPLTKEPNAPPSASADEALVGQRVAHRLRLTGTLAGPRPAALISGRVVRIGDRVDDYVVSEITAGRVVLRSAQREIALTVPQ